jgi:F0F1-type ATP synthase membrane subunit b/b'
MNYEAIAEWSQVASAVLFLAVLVWMWFKFIQPAVLAAQAAQNARVNEAERHRDEAKAALEGLHGEIGLAQRDALAIKDRIAAFVAAEREAILREAREAGERALRDAEGELARARAAARGQLRDELLEKALGLARETAARHMDAAADKKLATSFVQSLERSGR